MTNLPEPTAEDFRRLIADFRNEISNAIGELEEHITSNLLVSPSATASSYDRGFAEGVQHCRELAAKGVPPQLWGER